MSKASKEIERLEAIQKRLIENGSDTSMIDKQIIDKKYELTLYDDQYQQMLDGVSDKMADVNKTALEYVNGQTDSIYVMNFNQISAQTETAGIRFDLINEDVLRRRIQTGDIKTPYKKLFNIPKDKRWNTKQLNSAVVQGILQGEPMDKIAKRFYNVVNKNKNASIRNARTLVTAAENQGRLDSYQNLTDRGVVLIKRWLATEDERTRQWHLDMNEQPRDIDEPFEDGHGNLLMYPGDPDAEPETVYNCRCSMEAKIYGIRKGGDYLWRQF
jgi:hypothetical protein